MVSEELLLEARKKTKELDKWYLLQFLSFAQANSVKKEEIVEGEPSGEGETGFDGDTGRVEPRPGGDSRETREEEDYNEEPDLGLPDIPTEDMTDEERRAYEEWLEWMEKQKNTQSEEVDMTTQLITSNKIEINKIEKITENNYENLDLKQIESDSELGLTQLSKLTSSMNNFLPKTFDVIIQQTRNETNMQNLEARRLRQIYRNSKKRYDKKQNQYFKQYAQGTRQNPLDFRNYPKNEVIDLDKPVWREA